MLEAEDARGIGGADRVLPGHRQENKTVRRLGQQGR